LINRIVFLPLIGAVRWTGEPTTAGVSIVSPGQNPAALASGFVHVLRLWVDDLAEEMFRDTMSLDVPDEVPGGVVDVLGCRWFDLYHAREVVSFVRSLHESEVRYTLLVHCEAGVSRSSAVAKWASEISDAPIDSRCGDTSFANPRMLRLLQKADVPDTVQPG
jgi:predicted protein tyrosine phosphatase